MEPKEVVNELKETMEKRIKEEVAAQVRATIADIAPPKIEVVGPASDLRAMYDAMKEKRAITLNGSGAYNVLSEIVKVITTKYDLLQKVRYIYGAGAQTNIPVLAARPARPAAQAEGAMAIASDATASLAATTLTPKAYVSVLPISAEALVQGAADIEAQLPAIFADSFADAMLYGLLIGDGTMTGVFSDAALSGDISCAATGAPTWADFVKFAGALKVKNHSPTIVVHPDLTGNLLNDSTAGNVPLKNELLTRGNIRGVPVYEEGYAPTATTAGSVVAVGMDFANYAIGVARELVIEPLKKVGDTNTYYQASMFFNGKPILAGNGFQLKTI